LLEEIGQDVGGNSPRGESTAPVPVTEVKGRPGGRHLSFLSLA
jgi:hypothetical protein